jgi:hypothetical protein
MSSNFQNKASKTLTLYSCFIQVLVGISEFIDTCITILGIVILLEGKQSSNFIKVPLYVKLFLRYSLAQNLTTVLTAMFFQVLVAIFEIIEFHKFGNLNISSRYVHWFVIYSLYLNFMVSVHTEICWTSLI